MTGRGTAVPMAAGSSNGDARMHNPISAPRNTPRSDGLVS